MVDSLCRHFVICDDFLIQKDTAWGLNEFSNDGVSEKLDCLAQSGIVPQLTAKMCSTDLILAVPCLRIIGNLLAGSEQNSKTVIESGSLLALAKLVGHPK